MAVIICTVTNRSTHDRGAAARVLGALPTLVAILLLAFAIRWFIARWAEIGAEGTRPEVAWRWIAVAAALLVLHAGTAVVIWRQVLAAVGSPLPWRDSVDSWAPSLLARYVPGKVWSHAVRVALARRAGVAFVTTTGAILWEILLAITGAALIALLMLVGRDGATRQAAIGLIGGTAAVWGAVVFAGRHPAGSDLLHRLGGAAPARDPRVLLPALWTGMAGWLCFGFAHVAVAAAIVPVVLIDIPLIVRAVALAWAAGFVAFIVPMGLGVRDGVLLALLAPLLDPPRALLFVGLARLVQLSVDAAVTLLWLIARASRRSGSTTATPSAPPSA